MCVTCSCFNGSPLRCVCVVARDAGVKTDGAAAETMEEVNVSFSPQTVMEACREAGGKGGPQAEVHEALPSISLK